MYIYIYIPFIYVYVCVYRDLGGLVVQVSDGCWDGGCGAPISPPPNHFPITTTTHCGGCGGCGAPTSDSNSIGMLVGWWCW